MKVFRGLKKAISKSIKVLTKIYGVECKVYTPLHSDDLQHGYKDDNITYDDVPIYIGKLLIPHVIKSKGNTSDFIDELMDSEDIKVYFSDQMEIPRYSKIVVNNAVWSGSYKINQLIDLKDDSGTFYRTGILVPDMSVDVDTSREETELVEIDDDTEEMYIDDTIIPRKQERSKFKYSPIK